MKTNFSAFSCALYVLCMCLSVSYLNGQPLAAVLGAPQKMNYQAVARDASGNALVSQAVSVRFSIRDVSAGGSILYQETQNLTTNAFGLFTAAIGTGVVVSGTFSAIDWSASEKYLQVELDPAGGSSWIDMGTAQLLSVPYSFNSSVANRSLDNKWDTGIGGIYNVDDSPVGIGTNAPENPLHVTASNVANNEAVIKAVGANPTGSMRDVIGVQGLSVVDDYYGFGGDFQGGYRGVAGTVLPTGNGYYYGITGQAIGGTGNNYGVYGASDQLGMYGVGMGTGQAITTYYGSGRVEAVGVFGDGDVDNPLGISYGVVGEAKSTRCDYNAGVFGYGSNAAGTSTTSWGVLGITEDAASGRGVSGISYSTGISSRGVEGTATAGINQIGVYGMCFGSTPTSYAGYFSGPLYATNASSSIKAFKIDHPLDPENKYLFHSSVESDEMLNQYSGNVVTDNQGTAVVRLPSYFGALNRDFRYQLTVVGTFAQAIVAEKIKDNVFTIRTDKPNVEVSWLVMGIRKDPAAELYRIRPEVDKPATEKGFYLVPEAYGFGVEKSPHRPGILEKGFDKHSVRRPSDDPKNK